MPATSCRCSPHPDHGRVRTRRGARSRLSVIEELIWTMFITSSAIFRTSFGPPFWTIWAWETGHRISFRRSLPVAPAFAARSRLEPAAGSSPAAAHRDRDLSRHPGSTDQRRKSRPRKGRQDSIPNRPRAECSIVDDGGFLCRRAAHRSTRHGLGLMGMREKFQPLGGSLKIESTPGHGTRLLITVPRRD